MTVTGLTISFVFVNLLGVGLASGIVNNPAWADAYHISPGALILAGYGGLGGFGKFCAVVITLGLGSNVIPGTTPRHSTFKSWVVSGKACRDMLGSQSLR